MKTNTFIKYYNCPQLKQIIDYVYRKIMYFSLNTFSSLFSVNLILEYFFNHNWLAMFFNPFHRVVSGKNISQTLDNLHTYLRSWPATSKIRKMIDLFSCTRGWGGASSALFVHHLPVFFLSLFILGFLLNLHYYYPFTSHP